MKKIKQILKQDLESKTDIELSFNKTLLTDNSKKYDRKMHRKKVAIGVLSFSCCLMLCLISVPFFASLETKSSYKESKVKYSLNDLGILENKTFKKIGQVNYPNGERVKLSVDEKYYQSINNFAYKIYQELDGRDNISFSPISLFSCLNMISFASNTPEISNLFDELLCISGMSEEEKIKNYTNMYKSDFFSNNNGTLQMFNSAFLTNSLDYNQDFVNQLVDYYSEVYQLDFNKDTDVDKVIDWIEKASNQKGMVSKEDLEIKKDITSILFFSTLYFNNKWLTNYVNSNSYYSDFTKADNSTQRIKYMRHVYFGSVYDYGNYVSFYDRYQNDLRIKYIIPKDTNDLIYDVIGSNNFLFDDEEKETSRIINLSAPVFEKSIKLNFNDILQRIGLEEVYNPYGKALNNAFTNLNEESIYLEYVKQNNRVSFSESGTIVKSVSFASAGKPTSPSIIDDENAVQIYLNRPYIYVIYDHNNLPLYIGNVDSI